MNNKLTDEQLNTVHRLQMSLCRVILNMREEDIWDLITSHIDAQVNEAVAKFMKEEEE